MKKSDGGLSERLERGYIYVFIFVVFTYKSPPTVLQNIEQLAKSLEIGSLQPRAYATIPLMQTQQVPML